MCVLGEVKKQLRLVKGFFCVIFFRMQMQNVLIWFFDSPVNGWVVVCGVMLQITYKTI